ncbi:MAG: SDR family NAD(P)-dependent oxidoreductase [Saccharolobus sp.]|uniref:SDR family NAD(P)-dependent oxidoreductase n=1 Tax=Saccharolobus TaxID=2100760 RepID=UPI001F118276|nr:SDR family NAD(P)-dependent oxidoreductase [Saccharolobus shibatae]MCH4815471.1 SDR family NAD(P)-dependent oxidoreductase [Saccharolobus shibatae]
MGRLDNKKVAIIGVSEGLGYATAYFALKEGAQVCINSRNENKLKRMKETLSKYGNIHYVVGDVSSTDGARNVIDKCASLLNGIDHLVVTVGGYVEDTIDNFSGLEEMLTNHIKIPLYVINSSLRFLKEGSSVVLVSSMSGIGKASPDQLSYAVAKAGLAKEVEILASELLGRGIRVNGIAPTTISGEFEPERNWKKFRKLGDDMAPPEDFARIIIWLLTDESDWVDGVVIPAHGGARLK